MSLLITTSLIDSVNWAKNAPNSPCKDNPEITWKQKAYNDLKNTLARIYAPGGFYMERGVRIENTVYKIIEEGKVDTVSCSAHFKKVLDLCNGGVFQKKTKSFIDVDGQEYCLFGKIDVLFPKKKIIDLKTTGSFGGRDKYLKTLQHKIYCYNERISDFDYVIMEFESEENDKLRDVHIISYKAEDFDSVKADITKAIRDTMAFIEAFDEEGDLLDLYMHKFNMYN